MRRAKIFCCLLLVFIFAGGGATPFAADLGRTPYPEDRPYADDAPPERDLAAFCYEQRYICRKICRLRSNFDDDFDGCPQSCETRVSRCNRTGCYRWSEPEFLIAERFGGYKCPL